MWKDHALAALAVATGIVVGFVVWSYIGPAITGAIPRIGTA